MYRVTAIWNKNKRNFQQSSLSERPGAVTWCITSQWNKQQSRRIENNVILKWFSLKMWTDYKDWKREKRIQQQKGQERKIVPDNAYCQASAGRQPGPGPLAPAPVTTHHGHEFASLCSASTSTTKIAFWLCSTVLHVVGHNYMTLLYWIMSQTLQTWCIILLVVPHGAAAFVEYWYIYTLLIQRLLFLFLNVLILLLFQRHDANVAAFLKHIW